MNAERVDLLVQYALAVAFQNEEWKERELGPIHLLKYVYLADLAYAERNNGATFTESDWTFYKFGPWSAAVHDRIAPAAVAAPSVQRTIPYANDHGEGEFTRWKLNGDADQIIAKIESKIPAFVATMLRKHVRTFASDTPGLLQFVYRTEPMLHAAPNEPLAFVHAVPEPQPEFEKPTELTEKQRKRLREGVRELQAKLKARAAPRYVKADPAPVYDKVFEDGVTALNRDAGDDLAEIEGEVHFSDEVWKARGRHQRDAP